VIELLSAMDWPPMAVYLRILYAQGGALSDAADVCRPYSWRVMLPIKLGGSKLRAESSIA